MTFQIENHIPPDFAISVIILHYFHKSKTAKFYIQGSRVRKFNSQPQFTTQDLDPIHNIEILDATRKGPYPLPYDFEKPRRPPINYADRSGKYLYDGFISSTRSKSTFLIESAYFPNTLLLYDLFGNFLGTITRWFPWGANLFLTINFGTPTDPDNPDPDNPDPDNPDPDPDPDPVPDPPGPINYRLVPVYLIDTDDGGIKLDEQYGKTNYNQVLPNFKGEKYFIFY